jgi:sterol desaturase/sphingolipid hydroxylase (fatty acid hydroxylase superfamily)
MTRIVRVCGFMVLLLTLGALITFAPSNDWVRGCADKVIAKITWDRVGKIAVELTILLPLAFLIEGLAIGWRRSSVRRLLRPRCSAKMDLLLYLAGAARLPGIILTIIGFAGVTGLTLVGNGVLAGSLGLSDWTRVDDPILGFILFLVVRDFGYYWYHRLQHTPIFWPLHRMHHSAREFTVLSSYRTNFFGEILLGTFQAMPLSLLTLPDTSIVTGQLLVVMHGHLTHSEWRSRWGWIGRWLMVSPLHHRLHHGMRATEYKSNFATLPIWDRVFGTFREPQETNIAIGINHPAYETVGGCARMLVIEVYETARLLMGRPIHDPSTTEAGTGALGQANDPAPSYSSNS